MFKNKYMIETKEKAKKEINIPKEIPLIFSNKFTNYLNNMISISKLNNNGEENDISNILDLYRHKFEISFIDVTENEDIVTYLPLNRVIKIFKYKNLDKTFNNFDKFINTEENIYNIKDFISGYSGLWNTGRIKIKIGKLIKKLNPNLNDRDIEIFVNNFKALHRSRNNPKLSIVYGKEIEHWYSYANYAHSNENKRKEGLGTLGKSCMRYDVNYFDIYIKNSDVCQLLILHSNEDNSKILGRALIWKLHDGSMYMDRIYTHFDSDVIVFRNYANENGWSSYNNNIKSNKTIFNKVILTEFEFDYYPYMDTFYYLIPESNLLTNKRIKCIGGKTLRNTNGSFENGILTV